MKTKYVCRGRISLYVNFHNNRTMWSTNLHVKICRSRGGRKKPALFPSPHLQNFTNKKFVRFIRLLSNLAYGLIGP